MTQCGRTSPFKGEHASSLKFRLIELTCSLPAGHGDETPHYDETFSLSFLTAK
jgi:hypothetical protein